MVSTNYIPMYSPLTFGIRTIVFHIKVSAMYPFQNATCMTLTTFSQVLVSGYFSLVAIDGNYPLVITTATVVITITPFFG